MDQQSMDQQSISDCGDELYEAMRGGYTVAPLTSRYPNISLDDAYHISLQFLQRRRDAGEVVIGKKIGVTSPAVQQMLNVYQPDFGFLTDKMDYRNHAQIPLSGNLIQPRAEAEIAFLLNQDLVGPGITEQDVLAATGSIIPCFEIVDSRIENWQIKIEDTVADNASCGAYVLGEQAVDPRQFDLAELKVSVFKNGQPLSEGYGCAVQGNPLTAVAWLANTLGKYDIPFKAGEVILSGSMVPLEPVAPGDDMFMELHGVGSVSMKIGA
jgi:2-oxopent-4-enoate/cis-2-oxohex-4-enoate hydratase